MADVTVNLDPLSPGVVIGEDDFASGGSAYDDVTALTPVHGPGYAYPPWSSDQLVIAGTTPRTLRPAASGGDPVVLMGAADGPDYVVRVGFNVNVTGINLVTYTASAIGRASPSAETYYRLVYTVQRSSLPPTGAAPPGPGSDDEEGIDGPAPGPDGRPLYGAGGFVSQSLKLSAVVAGVVSATSSYTPALGLISGPHSIELRMDGSDITGWLDGAQVLSLSDSSIADAGSPGLGAASATSPSDGAGTPLTSFYAGDLSPSAGLAALGASGDVAATGVLGAASGLALTPPPTDASVPAAPLPAEAGLASPSAAFDWSQSTSPLPSAAALAAGAAAAFDWSQSTSPLPSAAALAAGAEANVDWAQVPPPLAAASGLAGASFVTGLSLSTSPLAAASGLPDPAFATTVDATTQVNALAAAAALALSAVGTGRTVAPGPLAGPGGMPAASVSGGAGVVATPPPLAAPAGMRQLSFAFDDEVVVGLIPLAGGGGLAAGQSGGAALAPGPLAGDPGLGAAGAVTSFELPLRPLRSAATMILAPSVGEAHVGVSSLAAPAGLPTLSAYNPSSEQIVAVAPLAADSGLLASQTSPHSDAEFALAPLAAPAGLLASAVASLVYVDQGAWARLGPGELDSNYPFVNPSLDLRHLIAEANFTYEADEYLPPVRVVWIAGLDRAFNLPDGPPASPPYTPPGESPQADASAVPDYTPAHPCDVVLWDAEDNVVFDSTQADYRASYYGPYFYVHRWRTPTAVLRITQRIAFPTEADAYRVPGVIKPVNGVFDERVTEVSCRKVTSFTLNGLAPARGVGSIEGGYNVAVSTSGQSSSGIVRTGVIDVGAAPGSGLGRYPSCDDPDDSVSEIGAGSPDAYGTLRLAGDGCYNFHPEATIEGGVAHVAPGKVVVGSECTACCSCSDFVGLAVQVIRLWQELQAIGAEAEAARDAFKSGVDRWKLLQPSGPPAFLVQTKALLHNLHYVDQVVQVCHMTDECLEDFSVELEAIVLGDNHDRTRIDLIPDSTTINTLCGSEDRALIARSSETSDQTPIFILDDPPLVGGTFAVRLNWDAIQPRTYGVARLRYSIVGIDYSLPTAVRINVKYPGGPQVLGVTVVPGEIDDEEGG